MTIADATFKTMQTTVPAVGAPTPTPSVEPGAAAAAGNAVPAAPVDSSKVGGGAVSSIGLADVPASTASTLVSPAVLPAITPPVPAAPPAPAAQGLSFQSWGDPHEVSGDGLQFDNMGVGTYTALKSASGDLQLDKKHEKVEGLGAVGSTVNTEAGIKFGTDLITYKAGTDALTVNGKPVTLAEGQKLSLPDGGSLTKKGNTYEAVSAKGDAITIIDQGKYLDFKGAIAASRTDGEVTGSLGRFDADTSADNDLMKADGTKAANVDDFIKSWETKPGASLLEKKPEDLSKFAAEKTELQGKLDVMLKEEDALGKERLPILKQVDEMKGTVELLKGLKPDELTEGDLEMIKKFDGLSSKLETLNNKISELNRQEDPIRKRIAAITEIQGIEVKNKEVYGTEQTKGAERTDGLKTAFAEAGVKTMAALQALGDKLKGEPAAILSTKEIDLQAKIPGWITQFTALTDLIRKLNEEQAANIKKIEDLDNGSKLPAAKKAA